MAFHVGQKVVCVNAVVGAFDSPEFLQAFKNSGDLDGLVEGQVYTIREVIPSDKYYDGQSVRLAEIYRGPSLAMDGAETPFAAARFRPLQEQGMSILRAILADPKVKIKETA